MSDDMTTTGNVTTGATFALRTPGPAFVRYTGDGEWWAICDQCAPQWGAPAFSQWTALSHARQHNVASHGRDESTPTWVDE